MTCVQCHSPNTLLGETSTEGVKSCVASFTGEAIRALQQAGMNAMEVAQMFQYSYRRYHQIAVLGLVVFGLVVFGFFATFLISSILIDSLNKCLDPNNDNKNCVSNESHRQSADELNYEVDKLEQKNSQGSEFESKSTDDEISDLLRKFLLCKLSQVHGTSSERYQLHKTSSLLCDKNCQHRHFVGYICCLSNIFSRIFDGYHGQERVYCFGECYHHRKQNIVQERVLLQPYIGLKPQDRKVTDLMCFTQNGFQKPITIYACHNNENIVPKESFLPVPSGLETRDRKVIKLTCSTHINPLLTQFYHLGIILHQAISKKKDHILGKEEKTHCLTTRLQDDSLEQLADQESVMEREETHENRSVKTHLDTKPVIESVQCTTDVIFVEGSAPEQPLPVDEREQMNTDIGDFLLPSCGIEKEQQESSSSKKRTDKEDKALVKDSETTSALLRRERSSLSSYLISHDTFSHVGTTASRQVSMSESEATTDIGQVNCHENDISRTAYSDREFFEFSYGKLHQFTGGFDTRPVKQGGYQIGTGSYGEVFYCRMPVANDDVQDVAIKRMKQPKSAKLSHVKLAKRQFAAELMAMTRCCHPNIVRLIGQCSEGPHLCVVYEFVSGGNLAVLIRKGNPNPPLWHLRLRIMCDIACALEYLHTTCKPALVHRDVKNANILVSTDLRAKLADFGLCINVDDENDPWTSFLVTSAVGTRAYMAPEAFKGKVSPQLDVYSFGVLLYELITGLAPFSTVTKKDLVTYMRDLERDGCDPAVLVDPRAKWISEVSSDLLKLSRWTTDYDSHNRPLMTVVVSILKMLIRDHLQSEDSV